jgi:hypothetical protein
MVVFPILQRGNAYCNEESVLVLACADDLKQLPTLGLDRAPLRFILKIDFLDTVLS